MKKIIIWILVVMLVLGFVYVANNILIKYTESQTKFSYQYIPDVPFLLEFNQESEQLAKECYNAPIFTSDISNFSNSYLMIFDDDSQLVISKIENSVRWELDKIAIILKYKEAFEINRTWKRGFPILQANKANKKYFISGWKNNLFIAQNSDALNYMFDSITQKEKLLSDNPLFKKLWDEDSNCTTFATEPKCLFVEDILSIPFYSFNYPLSFTIENGTINIRSIADNTTKKLSVPIYSFENALIEVALPEAVNIKEKLIESRLSTILAEKNGILIEQYSFFFSDKSAEFILHNNDGFSFILSSNSLENKKYENEIKIHLPKAQIIEKKLGNYTLREYKDNHASIYTLDLPNLFIISTEEEIFEEIISSNNNLKNKSAYIKVKNEFNDLIALYHLNLNKVVFPDNFTQCTLIQKDATQEIVETEIKFK
ncbi:MAG: hypothetical protein U9Q18_02185 [Caldisericota bacterium]|nr:hypothetical protein [Caldisericota bacterium]